jgi:DNA-binding MarR family transcriptional regulator
MIDPFAGHFGTELRWASLITLGALGEHFAAFGLRAIDGGTLQVIEANPGCNQAEIGRLLGVQRTNMVPIIAALVKSGYIERRPADKRSHALHLTPTGHELNSRLRAIVERIDAFFFGDLDAESRAVLRTALKSIKGKDLALLRAELADIHVSPATP